MKLAIVHYHLNRGGVVQVIINHLLALDRLIAPLVPELVVLCHGGRREGWPEDLAERFGQIRLTQCIIPELDYDEGTDVNPQPAMLAQKITDSLRSLGCRSGETVLHFHNHALGKNLSLPGAVNEISKAGFPLLLQVHDFVEDFRPANYRRLQAALSPNDPDRLSDMLYPQASHIHYAVLNGRDNHLLREAGIDERQLHFLPNPVPAPTEFADCTLARMKLSDRFGIATDCRFVLYPVRGIRRKNLGEALLWAAVAGAGTTFGFTLPPINPIEIPPYQRWRALAAELRLPCVFEVGCERGLRLPENLAACHRVLTTSVAEGFGLVYLETCLYQRSLIGRNLPEITGDFIQRGVTFAGLRSRIDIPIDWIGRAEFLDMLERTFNATLKACGRRPLVNKLLQEGLEMKLQNECVDFGDLDADLQERVLRRVCSDRGSSQRLVTTNPWLVDAITSRDSEFFIEADRNADIVRREYSPEATGHRLVAAYRAVLESPRQSSPGILTAGSRILDSFLNLSRFRPVRL